MENTIIKNYSSAYENNWVALDAFVNGNVVAYGKDLQVVHKKAIDKGVKNPIVFYLPHKDGISIFFENAL